MMTYRPCALLLLVVSEGVENKIKNPRDVSANLF